MPRRVQECRCGFSQVESTPGTFVEDSYAVPARPRALGLPLLGVGLVLGAALAMIPMRSRLVSSPVLTTAPSAASPSPTSSDSSALPEPGAPVTILTEAGRSTPTLDTTVVPDTSSNSLEDLVSRVVPAVASIQAGTSRGTGFFIRYDQLLTNAHVVEGHSTVQLQVGQTSYSARVAAVSEGNDLAVLQVYNASRAQPTLRLGSAAGARVGQEVIAVGSALGVLSNTVTRGIVSAVRQAGHVTLIQTDAAINPGNSGGPLVDRSGLVIGVTSLRVARQAAEGVAFAVAIDHAASLLNGQSSSDSQTPLRSLTQMLSGPSEGDELRARGEQEYGRILEWAARNGDELDTYWNRYSQTCVMSAPTYGDRAWFAVYEANGVRINPASTYNCAAWLDNVMTNALKIRGEVEKAAEAARQRGVYPGTARDLRRRYRMQWNGWDR